MRELDDLIKAEYDGEISLSEKCKTAAVLYIRENETVAHEDVIFIKRLTKIASRILAEDSFSLDGLLTRLFEFNLQGIEKVEQGNMDGYSLNNIKSIHSHFYSHAANIAKYIFYNTDDIEWAKKWYDCSEKSAILSEEIYPEHSGNAYVFTGNAANILFEHTGDVMWAEKAYDYFENVVFLLADIDLRKCGLTYMAAAIAAQTIFEKSKEIEWAERAFDCSKEAVFLFADFDSTRTAYAYNIAGEMAKTIFNREGNIRWAKEWYESMINAGNFFRKEDTQRSAYCYGFAGDAARAIFRITYDAEWLKKEYHSTKKAALLSKNFDGRHSCVSYSFAGDAAKEFSNYQGDPCRRKKWAKKAMNCYTRFLDFYKANPGVIEEKTYEIVCLCMDELKTGIKLSRNNVIPCQNTQKTSCS